MLDLVDYHVFSEIELVDLEKRISSRVSGQDKSRWCWCTHMTSKWSRGLDWCLIWARVKVFATGHEVAHLLDWFWSAAGFYCFSYLRTTSIQPQYHESWSNSWFFLIVMTVDNDFGSPDGPVSMVGTIWYFLLYQQLLLTTAHIIEYKVM